MIRFRLYYDKDKEIEWLNRMAAEGYAMESFFCGFYRFAPCEKGEWQYQVDIGKGFFVTDRGYVEFMEEMGVEVVQQWGPWVTLRRKAQEGEFALYTDVDGQIAQYKKILLMFKIVVFIELLALAYEVYAGCQGIMAGWGFACLILAFLIAFFNIIIRTKRIILELLERKGEAPPEYNGRTVSPFVPAGLLLDSVTLIIQDHLPRFMVPLLLGVSIGLILYGSVRTAVRRKKQ